jgi:hypothetical protein
MRLWEARSVSEFDPKTFNNGNLFEAMDKQVKKDPFQRYRSMMIFLKVAKS